MVEITYLILIETIQELKKQKLWKRVLQHLDEIFDYLTLEELAQMVFVNKYFWYVATMDKLYLKFGMVPSETLVEESLWSYKISEIYSTLKALSNQNSFNNRASGGINRHGSSLLMASLQQRLEKKGSIMTLKK